MGFLKKLFQRKPPVSQYDALQSSINPLIISTYRKMARQLQTAPTDKTSDAEILEVYAEVLTKFKEASRAKGAELPAPTINYIVFYFLGIYEKNGNAVYQAFLEDELRKYQTGGLRQLFADKRVTFF